jgi:hypothetical protein
LQSRGFTKTVDMTTLTAACAVTERVIAGIDPELDAEVAGPVLAFAHETLVDEGARANRIGPEVAVPSGASITDRLVGFLGRTP